MSADFPKKLGAKLKQIRERTRLDPDKFALRVKAKDGAEILSYENDEGDMPISVLWAYCSVSGVPIENLMDDDRDLWFGHRQN
jgi:hypothetical protein